MPVAVQVAVTAQAVVVVVNAVAMFINMLAVVVDIVALKLIQNASEVKEIDKHILMIAGGETLLTPIGEVNLVPKVSMKVVLDAQQLLVAQNIDPVGAVVESAVIQKDAIAPALVFVNVVSGGKNVILALILLIGDQAIDITAMSQ